MTLPVYSLPSGLTYRPDQSSVHTVLASGTSSRPGGAGLSVSFHVVQRTAVFADGNPAFGLQLHHPRFLEFVGAPESACLLYRSPTFWVDQLGEEQAMVAAVNLQRDAGIMLSNLQILLPRRCTTCRPK